MRDLAEIRRFWPWVRAKDQKPSRGFYPRNRRGVYMGLGYSEALWKFPAGWNVWVTDDRPWQARKSNPWSGSDIETEAGVRHPTIAAAMAAAGFGVRPKGWRAIDRIGRTQANKRTQQGLWPDYCRVPLQSRQRPHKKVRLGKRGRRLALAASLYAGLQTVKMVRQQRLDRGEIGG
jgi:hypothetical protein